MANRFTDEQLKAIKTLDKSVLVSAAAGSGKTSVLIERIIRIILEGRAVDTPANFQNVARMIDPARPVVIITSGYHMLRASAIARDAGFTDVRRLSAKCDPVFLPANIAWEIVCEIDRLTQRMKKHRGGRT